jgi:hypothetical protein
MLSKSLSQDATSRPVPVVKILGSCRALEAFSLNRCCPDCSRIEFNHGPVTGALLKHQDSLESLTPLSTTCSRGDDAGRVPLGADLWSLGSLQGLTNLKSLILDHNVVFGTGNAHHRNLADVLPENLEEFRFYYHHPWPGMGNFFLPALPGTRAAFAGQMAGLYRLRPALQRFGVVNIPLRELMWQNAVDQNPTVPLRRLLRSADEAPLLWWTLTAEMEPVFVSRVPSSRDEVPEFLDGSWGMKVAARDW